MKKVFATVLIVLFIVMIIGASVQAGKGLRPGDVAGALGALTGYLLLLIGLFYSVRWKVKLNGHTYKVGRQAFGVMVSWYAIFAALIGILELTSNRTTTGLELGAGMLAIWTCVGYACWRWVRRLRKQETSSPAVALTPAPLIEG